MEIMEAMQLIGQIFFFTFMEKNKLISVVMEELIMYISFSFMKEFIEGVQCVNFLLIFTKKKELGCNLYMHFVVMEYKLCKFYGYGVSCAHFMFMKKKELGSNFMDMELVVHIFFLYS